jgi:ribosomal protein S18 acetylase RimI-like enzyme
MNINVKRFDIQDAPFAVQLVKSFASKDVSRAYMETFFGNPANYLIVAEVGGKSAGFLLAHALQRLKEDARKMFIYEIDVAEEFQRQGVGTRLIEYVVDVVTSERMLNAFVFTNQSNKGAVEFYKSTGGKIINGDDLMFVYEP